MRRREIIVGAAGLALAGARPGAAADAQSAQPASCSYSGPPPHLPFTAFPTDTLDPGKAAPKAVADRLDARFKELLTQFTVTAGAVTLWQPELGYWSTSIGPASATRFPYASVTKMVTSAIVFQLVDEKRLALDQTVDRWFPGFVNGGSTTIDHLLTHTSGLPEIYQAKGGFSDGRRYWPPAEMISLLSMQPPGPFCPGAHYFYSNINYVVLSAILEKVEGEPFAAIAKRRVTKPLGLQTFSIFEATSAGADVPPTTGATWTAPQIASLAGAAGGGGDTRDMLSILHAWLTGGLMPVAARNLATSLLRSDGGAGVGYGRGVVVVDVPPPEPPTTWICHEGAVPGYSAMVIYDVKRRTYIAAAVTNEEAAQPVANLMLRALDQIAA